MGEYRDYIFAARIIDQANAMLGNGKHASWTADDMRDLASSVAAETNTPGVCPVCAKPVHANTSARVAKHRDGAGNICTASGQWFVIAVTA